MTETPRMTDTIALARNRKRAKGSDLFLQKAAADEVQDRLLLVKKVFRSPALVTPFASVWPQDILNQASIVQDEDILPLRQTAHDLVIHSLALHWANDPVGQLIQCKRALTADGLFIGFTLAGQTLHELRSSLAQAESEVVGGLSPRVAPMPEIRDLGALLQRAGFAMPVADSVMIKTSYDNMWALTRDLRKMGESNALAGRLRHCTPPSVMKRAAQIYKINYGTDDNRVTATFELVVLTGWAPDESQPKPLRPGSAEARLADVLKTSEVKLSD